MKASDLMTSNPACCAPDTSLSDIARLMDENDCGEIPVVESMDDRKVIGVVTDRDIVIRAVAQGRNASDMSAADVMSRSPVTVQEDTDVQECFEQMQDHQIRRIPVVDRQGALCGIVAQADIALQAGRRETGEMVRDISSPH